MRPWRSYSPDPNAPEVLRLRTEAVRKARAGRFIPNRVEYLCSLATGKSVLDIGVVEHTSGAAENPGWLHGNLNKAAAKCVGVDVLENELTTLRAKGYNVICTDVTREPLPEKFDEIIAGEVLEHLDAPGRFMANCATMLKPGGRLVISAPNPWYANVVLKHLWHRSNFVDSADHVAWYDASVLYELGQRHGLQLDRFSPIGGVHTRTLRGKIFFLLLPLLLSIGLSPELFAKSIIYEFVRVSEE
jgi:SAM-dependent methyltransferase